VEYQKASIISVVIPKRDSLRTRLAYLWLICSNLSIFIAFLLVILK